MNEEFNTNLVFSPGKLTTVMDAQAGSSGKGKIAHFITSHSEKWTFACNAFAPQAGHWVRTDDGKEYFYQTLNASASLKRANKTIYLGPGSIIELPALFREINENEILDHELRISPLAGILQDIDAAYERGIADLDGKPASHDGTMKHGSTCHGVGAAAARRLLRKESVKLARDIPALKNYIADVPEEIMRRLDAGESGLLEIAQGFQLSSLYQFYPNSTYRPCTVSHALSEMMLPPIYAGPVVLNCRTFPIRINSNKYISKIDGHHMTWAEVEACHASGEKYNVFEGNSGGGYDDQREISWEELTKSSGSPKPIIEITSVTKLPRRVFTFSRQNLLDAIRYNKTEYRTFISLNFANYVDHEMAGRKGYGIADHGTLKFRKWTQENFPFEEAEEMGAKLAFVGTGMRTNEMIQLDWTRYRFDDFGRECGSPQVAGVK